MRETGNNVKLISVAGELNKWEIVILSNMAIIIVFIKNMNNIPAVFGSGDIPVIFQ